LLFFYTYTFLVDDRWERHVQTQTFDEECARCISKGSLSDNTDPDDDDSSVSSVESSRYEVSKLEAHFYYFGLRGRRRRGPKLIFRTSKDVFPASTGPEQDFRLMRLLPVYEHDKLGNADLWATIRSEVRDVLDVQQSVN
jgi:hypothetical protein